MVTENGNWKSILRTTPRTVRPPDAPVLALSATFEPPRSTTTSSVLPGVTFWMASAESALVTRRPDGDEDVALLEDGARGASAATAAMLTFSVTGKPASPERDRRGLLLRVDHLGLVLQLDLLRGLLRRVDGVDGVDVLTRVEPGPEHRPDVDRVAGTAVDPDRRRRGAGRRERLLAADDDQVGSSAVAVGRRAEHVGDRPRAHHRVGQMDERAERPEQQPEKDDHERGRRSARHAQRVLLRRRRRVEHRGARGVEPVSFTASPTHSSDPSVKAWCFQIGTVALNSSTSAWHTSNASRRCSALTAATTAISPMVRWPIRWTTPMRITPALGGEAVGQPRATCSAVGWLV